MPRVPTYDTFQATPNTLPQTRMTMPEMPDVAGQQAQQMGRAMMAGGQQIGQVALDMQQQANQLRVDDALNKAKEAALRLTYDKDVGFTNLRGINALERPDGKPLADEYADTLKRNIDDIAGTLGNDAQRQAFSLRSNDILTSMRGSAIQHEAQEFKTYALSTSEGIQSTALREIGLNWQNPDTVNSAVERIRAETYRQAQLLGKSAEWQEAQARKLTSNAHKVALLSALEQNDPAYADAYLKKYSGQMDADDILTARGHVTKAMDAKVGFTAASEVLGKMQPRIQVGEAERAFNIALGTESNNRQFGPDGKPLTSPKGAIGIAQVMPDTAPEAAKLAGLPWDENRYKNDPAYNKALGMAYFQRQLQENGGDLAKAYAAYNGGPDRLQKAIKKAETSVKLNKTDPNVQVHTWLDFMPKETRDYVAKNMRAFEAGQGQPSRPTFQEIDDQLRADPRLADNPARYKVAREEAERQFNEQTKAIKQREDEAVDQAMRGIMQNGGSFATLPVALRSAVPPGEVDRLMNYAERIAKGQKIETNWALYYDLKRNPGALVQINLNTLRDKLSDTEFKELVRDQDDARSGKVSSSTQIRSTHDVIANMMREAGIDPTPKDDDKAGATKAGQAWAAVETRIRQQEQALGRKLTPDEAQKEAARVFTSVEVIRPFWTNANRAALQVGASDRVVVPVEERPRIKAALRARGIPVNEINVANLYRRSLNIPDFKAN